MIWKDGKLLGTDDIQQIHNQSNNAEKKRLSIELAELAKTLVIGCKIHE